jgi:hypothetical protein
MPDRIDKTFPDDNQVYRERLSHAVIQRTVGLSHSRVFLFLVRKTSS